MCCACAKVLCACECVLYYMVYVNICEYVPCVQYGRVNNNNDDDVKESNGNSNSDSIDVLYCQLLMVLCI